MSANLKFFQTVRVFTFFLKKVKNKFIYLIIPFKFIEFKTALIVLYEYFLYVHVRFDQKNLFYDQLCNSLKL